MPRTSRGLYVFTRHSADCKYHSEHGETDRTENRRCNCMKYIAGTAPDGAKIRQSANTTSWERARKLLLRLLAQHDPRNKLLFELANANAAEQQQQPPQRKTVVEAVRQFLETKRGENVVDVAHYEGFFERQLLPWCKEQGIQLLRDLNLETFIRKQLRIRCLHVHRVRKERKWQDLAMRQSRLILRYRPGRVACPRCGIRVEDFPWAEPWARVTRALGNAVARLGRELSWQGTARQYGLNWRRWPGL